MSKYTIRIQLHPSIPAIDNILEDEVDQEVILEDALIALLSKEQAVLDQLVMEDEIRPGYLLISNKTELRTTKQLKNKINRDIEVKIIPISHGG